MWKIPKILKVGSLVAASQLLGVCAASYLTKNDQNGLLAQWAALESILLITVSMIFFGHQHSLNRLIVREDIEYKKELIEETKSRMFSVAALIALVYLLISFWLGFHYVFAAIIALLIGMSPDFALYGLSRPIAAAMNSFLKVVIPIFGLFLIVYFDLPIMSMYLFFAIAYVISFYIINSLIALSFSLPIIEFKNIKYHISQYKLGLPSFLLTYLRSIPIIYVGINHNYMDAAVIVLIYKYYLLSIGVKRLFIQTYYKKINDYRSALQLDLIMLFLALACLVTSYLFIDQVKNITGLTETHNQIRIVQFLSILVFIFPSSGTRLILKGKDCYYMWVHILSAFILSVGILLSTFTNSLGMLIFWIVLTEVLLQSLMISYRFYNEFFFADKAI